MGRKDEQKGSQVVSKWVLKYKNYFDKLTKSKDAGTLSKTDVLKN